MKARDHVNLTLPQRKLLIELEHVPSRYVWPTYKPLTTLVLKGLAESDGSALASRWKITPAGREWLRKWRGAP